MKIKLLKIYLHFFNLPETVLVQAYTYEKPVIGVKFCSFSVNELLLLGNTSHVFHWTKILWLIMWEMMLSIILRISLLSGFSALMLLPQTEVSARSAGFSLELYPFHRTSFVQEYWFFYRSITGKEIFPQPLCIAMLMFFVGVFSDHCGIVVWLCMSGSCSELRDTFFRQFSNFWRKNECVCGVHWFN